MRTSNTHDKGALFGYDGVNTWTEPTLELLPRDAESVPRGYVYCRECDIFLPPGDAFDCVHGVPFGVAK